MTTETYIGLLVAGFLVGAFTFALGFYWGRNEEPTWWWHIKYRLLRRGRPRLIDKDRREVPYGSFVVDGGRATFSQIARQAAVHTIVVGRRVKHLSPRRVIFPCDVLTIADWGEF